VTLIAPTCSVEILLAGSRVPYEDLRYSHIAAARRINHARMKVGGNIANLAVGSIELHNLRVLRAPDVAGDLNSVFVVKCDNRSEQIGTGAYTFSGKQ
jgi:hypothetical protein